ncbi:MAG TPA: SPW repeat protein [Ohtaekwangia sp.]|uniref:SPW repeat protein n=1 Tax=Ohtaekwangia sp. TaxID=2066019 RepID=UPI002F93F0CF
MKFISTKVHGVLDYLVGSLLISIPWLLGFAGYGQETWVLVIAGISIMIYSLFTRYEAGLIKILPVTAHLTFDFVLGICLIVSPWILGFDALVYIPHVAAGIIALMLAIFTRSSSDESRLHEPGLFERGYEARTSEEPWVAEKGQRGPWVTR